MFREAVEQADKIFQEIAGFSIKAEMMKSEENSRITETQYAQPANFVIQYALTETMRSEGLEPAAVVGHSVGEISSAWAAGMLSLREALHVAMQLNDLETAEDKLKKAISRTNGCVLRMMVDGNGPERDWITDCTGQQAVYDLLDQALTAISP